MQRTGVQLNSARGTIVTGTLFAPVLQPMIEKFNEKFSTSLSVLAVNNTYFGGDVSVAGLLTGQDLMAVSDRLEADFVLIPKQMLKSDEEVMLDGVTLAQVEKHLGLPVYAVGLQELPAKLSSR
jgi:NifB/MoaA-like Fe-S oxidoreductase